MLDYFEVPKDLYEHQSMYHDTNNGTFSPTLYEGYISYQAIFDKYITTSNFGAKFSNKIAVYTF